MKKTLLIIACVIVLVSLLLVSCGKKDNFDKNETTSTTKGETTTIAIFTEESTGEKYVTNKNGEHIPITTGKNGEIESFEDLITKTAKQVEEEKATANQNQGGNSQTPTQQTTKAADAPDTTGSSGSGNVEIGTGSVMDEEHAAVIDWSN